MSDLSSPLPQSLSALAQLPEAAAATARGPLLAAVAASASSFPPPTVTKALAALEVLAAPAPPPEMDVPPVQVSAKQHYLLQHQRHIDPESRLHSKHTPQHGQRQAPTRLLPLPQDSPRSRLAAMQTLEDYVTASSDEDSAGTESMQRFVTGLSAAQQVQKSCFRWWFGYVP
jgi:hypothetical protein